MKKKKPNLTDIIIISAVILCAVGIAARYTVIKNGVIGAAEKETVIGFISPEVSPEIAELITSADKLYYEDGTVFGTLLEGYFIADASAFSAGDGGETTVTQVRCVTGELSAQCIKTSSGVLCGGRLLHIGDKLTLHCDKYVVDIKITSVD